MLISFVLVFSNAEYRIALVDFICSSRGRLERDRGFANPLSLSNTSPDPWGCPLRRGISAAAGLYQFRQLYSGAVVTPQVRILCSFLCSGWYRSRFSWGVGLVSLVFHYWGEVLFVPAATWCFAFSFVGFALTASGSFVWIGNGMG